MSEERVTDKVMDEAMDEVMDEKAEIIQSAALLREPELDKSNATTDLPGLNPNPEPSDSEDGLEEEDRELLEENLGRFSGFRRLQSRHSSSSIEGEEKEEFESDVDEEDAPRLKRKRVAAEELEKMFHEDEELEEKMEKVDEELARSNFPHSKWLEKEDEDEDDLADFIEEEEEEEGGNEAYKGISSRIATKKSKFLEQEEFKGLPSRVLKDILDIFGDGTDYLGLVEEDEGEGEQDNKNRERNGRGGDHKKVTIDPIISTDIPERMQLAKRPMPLPGEIEAEAAWIALRLSSHEEKFTSVDQSVLIATIASVLRLFTEQMLEVPTVATHRKEHFQQLMGLNDLWAVWDLDEQWSVVHRQQKRLLETLSGKVEEKENLTTVIHAAESLETLQVVGDYLRWAQKEEERRQDSIVELARSFTLTLPQFTENLQCGQPVHIPVDPPGKPESTSLEDLASYLAAFIGHHPYGQLSLRAALEPLACITVTPTERGEQEIDAQHELASIKYLSEKPAVLFQDDQFLLLVKGATTGLLNFEVVLPHLNATVEHLVQLYGATLNNQEWGDLRRTGLVRAINEIIIPKLKKAVIAKLRDAAEKWVATAGQYSLQDKLMMRPTDGKILTLTTQGDTFDKNEPVVGVVLDKGRILDSFSERMGGSWIERLEELLMDHEPSMVLVAGRGMSLPSFYDKVAKHVPSMKLKFRPVVRWGDDDVGRIYMNSTRGIRDWPEASPLLRYCIAVGQRFTNPLFEICAMTDGELLALMDSEYPLASTVSKERRLKYLQRALVNVVNLVGININDAIGSVWMRSPIKYVCGLGPVKADALLKSLTRRGSVLQSRNALLEHVGPRVFANCASFIIISGGKRDGEPLDATRIHPENYTLARKMAADALELSLDEQDSETAATEAVRKIMQQPGRLDDLLLDEYAKELVKRGQQPKHLTLPDIKAELQNPYADLRSPPPVNNPEEATFQMVTGESERTLWPGVIVRATIIKPGDRMDPVARCRLQSGLSAKLPERGDRFRAGQAVTCRVVAIHPGTFSVELAIHREGDHIESKYPTDQYYDGRRKNVAKRHVHSPTRSTPQFKPIVHSVFQNMSRAAAEAHLEPAVLGEVVLRPSRRGPDYLTLTCKIDPRLYQHIEIQVRGGDYWIGNRQYGDIDEILARHVEPISAYLRDVRDTPKFVEGGVEGYLQDARKKEPERIAYCLSLSKDRPGDVVISFQPASRPYHELVQVTPDGFVLRGKHFHAIEALIAWFKQNYRNK
jgi:transcription elongation factor SPT6